MHFDTARNNLEVFWIDTKNNITSGTRYTVWFPVPDTGNRDTYVSLIVDDRRFQIRIAKKIDSNTEIRLMIDDVGIFELTKDFINADNCKDGYSFAGDKKKFHKEAGDLTFLKSTTQLQIWFNDVLEVTWIYENTSDTETCAMGNVMTGLKFQTTDEVSTHYQFELGNLLLSIVF